MKKLFPQFLPPGSKGPAVKFLQLLLLAGGFGREIVPDGDFGAQTEKGVRALQSALGIPVDGHFGPDTRAAYLESSGVDVNAIEIDAFVGETIVPPEA